MKKLKYIVLILYCLITHANNSYAYENDKAIFNSNMSIYEYNYIYIGLIESGQYVDAIKLSNNYLQKFIEIENQSIDYVYVMQNIAQCNTHLGDYINSALCSLLCIYSICESIDSMLFCTRADRIHTMNLLSPIINNCRAILLNINTNNLISEDILYNELKKEFHNNRYYAHFSFFTIPSIRILEDAIYNSILLQKNVLLYTDIQFSIVSSLLSHDDIMYTEQYFSNSHATTREKLSLIYMEQSNIGKRFTNHLELLCSDVKMSLTEIDIAIEFISCNVTNDIVKYFCLLLRQSWHSPKLIELCNENDLNTPLPQCAKTLDSKNTTIIYDHIWSKLEPYINEGDNVYFAPDGLLHQINIEVLQDAEGRLANEKWNLHRVSSTRELCMKKSKIDISSAALYGGLTYDMDNSELMSQSRTTLLSDNKPASRGFVADSTMRSGWKALPATMDEIDAIEQMFKVHQVKVNSYTKTIGNEESFKALSGKKTTIIHLATHGFFYKNEEAKHKNFFRLLNIDNNVYETDNSLKRSGLILAGAQRAWQGKTIPDSVEDGILLAEEIATMDLTGTDLVVLSACDTGLGDITSEGVFGLQRAFKKAGVQTLIMSLWKVDDKATSLFMQIFYKHWLGGKNKHEAFTLAQKTVREHKYYSNPYYWAGFIMLD